jgi:hypothetical protein
MIAFIAPYTFTQFRATGNTVKGKKVKISLLQAMEAHRVVRG